MIGRGMKTKYLQIIPLPIIPLPKVFFRIPLPFIPPT